ncbi:MAG: tRNA (adenosine(37)-N6)-dimethylallyltransferase MiaA [Oscillospiraceae bacterium]|nr:tRNA (adenosine(37)-N6)-dimethylallyltransferase MiaA [Oscillospiraceae bacterium]
MLQKLIIVCGPTASGKTAKSVQIAKANNGEIICADSMQIYDGMPICTASPTDEEKQGIPHHLFNFVPLSENMTVWKYAKLAHEKIAEISGRGGLPILVGGTGLYIDSVAQNLNYQNIDCPPEISVSLNSKENDELYEDLKRLDSLAAEKIPSQNRRRLIRALEICYATGRAKTEIDEQSRQNPKYDATYIGTYFERANLYERIDNRVDIMLENGLLGEIEHIYKENKIGQTAMQSIGCKELFPYFKGEISLEDAVENIKKITRNYAKRQMTWFKRNKEIIWLKQD